MAKTIPMRAGECDRPHWLPWSAFPFQTRFAQLVGKRIHYIDEGSGPALLLVSAGQWSFMFRDVIVRLRGQFRSLTLDFPGCGLSPDVPGYDHSVQANAQILEGFVDATCRTSPWLSTMSAGRSAFWSPPGGRSGSARW
jgi:pimeloyl-ACP methyl ester carboxylesterase